MKQHFNIRLSRKQRKRLTKIYKSETGKASERAHMVLLYKDGYSPKEIAKICMRNINTVYSALRRFSEEKFDGLYDKPRSGATPKLSEEDEKYLFSCLEKSPKEFGYFCYIWTVGMMLHLLKTKRKIQISDSALRNLLHKRKWAYNRPKHIPPKSDPMLEEDKKEIIRLLKAPNDDEILFFEDEVDFQLLPYLCAAWMLIGQQQQIPTPGQNKILCCYGFFNPHNQQFLYKLVVSRKNKNARNFIAALHQIRHQFPNKIIHIVVDNSSIHSQKTKLLKAFRETYSQHVKIHFLPKRAPILNPIEPLWKVFKKNIVGNWLHNHIDQLKAAFLSFVRHYRANNLFNFDIQKLIDIWEKYPTFESLQNCA